MIGPTASIELWRRSRTPGTCGRRISPADVDPGGLEVSVGYKPQRDSGTFSYAAHAVGRCGRSRASETSRSSITSIVEDGGVLVNPMVVGRPDLWRPGAGHRHRAVRRDAVRRVRPAAGDDASPTICCPGRPRSSGRRVFDHMETPSPYTQFGVKGIGEGGAIAPPAAIANAVNDALRPLGVELMQSPITPHRIVEAVLAAARASETAA